MRISSAQRESDQRDATNGTTAGCSGHEAGTPVMPCRGTDDRNWINQLEWKQVWTNCSRITHRWRIPPRWSRCDWHEEIDAEAFVAAMEALAVFDPSYKVQPTQFLRGRILGRAIARYRKEWGYALRLTPATVDGEISPDGHQMEELTALRVDLLQGLSSLPEFDRRIIVSLYWFGKTEAQIAADLGISQQWVSKRKRITIEVLRRRLRRAGA